MSAQESTPLSPGENELAECKTLTFNQDTGINLVFIGSKIDTQEYMEYFFSLEPFSSHEQDFNVYYIDNYEPTCSRYRGIALLCYNKEVLEKAASCPSPDAVMVLTSDRESIRSSAYMGVASINLNHPHSVFAHEFGHLFGNFAEEYLSEVLPANQPNCKASQGGFTSEVDGVYQECSKSTYYRSIEEGFMRSLRADRYGIYNEQILKQQIETHYSPLSAAGFAIYDPSDCAKESYYMVEATYDGQNLQPIDIFINKGCLPNTQAGTFSYEGASGERSFFEPILFTDAPGEEVIDGETFVDPALPLYIPLPLSVGPSVTFHDEQHNQIGSINMMDAGARLCKR